MIQNVIRSDRMIRLENHYGADVWTDTETDPIRKQHCLCWKCEKLTCVKETNCPIAQKLFEIEQNVTFILKYEKKQNNQVRNTEIRKN